MCLLLSALTSEKPPLVFLLRRLATLPTCFKQILTLLILLFLDSISSFLEKLQESGGNSEGGRCFLRQSECGVLGVGLLDERDWVRGNVPKMHRKIYFSLNSL